MKNHEMRLHAEPFEMIASGKKTVEYRLNDEKRREIKVGDTITFYKRPDEKETITVEVTKLEHYPDLLAMYTATFDLHLKDNYATPEDAVKDTPYYSKEEIARLGCLAIHFVKLPNN